MAAGMVRFPERPDEAARRLGAGVTLSPVADYLMWAVTAPGAAFGLPDDTLMALDRPGCTRHVDPPAPDRFPPGPPAPPTR